MIFESYKVESFPCPISRGTPAVPPCYQDAWSLDTPSRKTPCPDSLSESSYINIEVPSVGALSTVLAESSLQNVLEQTHMHSLQIPQLGESLPVLQVFSAQTLAFAYHAGHPCHAILEI